MFFIPGERASYRAAYIRWRLIYVHVSLVEYPDCCALVGYAYPAGIKFASRQHHRTFWVSRHEACEGDPVRVEARLTKSEAKNKKHRIAVFFVLKPLIK